MAPALACLSQPRIRSELPGDSEARPAGIFPPSDPDVTWAIEDALPGVTFQNPVLAIMAPGDREHWYVGEREGRLLRVSRQDPGRGKNTVLDLRDRTLGWQDAGFLGLAFHPQFGQPGSPNRGYIYVWYNHTASPPPGPRQPYLGSPSANRLSRFTVPDGSTVADPASELVLIEQERTNTDHQGGGMFFHPGDGFLYLGVGDGGHPIRESRGSFISERTDDPQRIDRDLLSGVLRIDVDRRGGAISHPIRRQPTNGRTQGYFVPNDNPWVDESGAHLEEFFAIGLRNPHRMTVDLPSGRILAGDVGEGRYEEVNLIERAGNYQWNFLEGPRPFAPRPARLLGQERPPVYSYLHRGFMSIIGGYVYRGQQHPELRGAYLFAEIGTGQVFAIAAQALESRDPVPRELLRLPQEATFYGGLSSFAVDSEGELYLCLLGRNAEGTGTLQKLVRRQPPPDRMPATLSATGLFQDTATLTARPHLFFYEVNVPFWSDHARKRRWLLVPEGRSIGFSAEGDWRFPPGTVAVKHFDMQLREDDPTALRRLETRILVVDPEGGAYGRTYKWRPDGRQADLMTAPVTERLTQIAREPFGPLQPAAIGGRGRGRLTDTTSLESPAGGILFAYAKVEPAFDVAARVEDPRAGRVGLMARAGLEARAGYLFAAREAGGAGHGPRWTIERGGDGGAPEILFRGPGHGPWVRLEAAGDTLAIWTGPDGHLWFPTTTVTGLESPFALLGLAARGAGGPAKETAVARGRASRPVRNLVRDHTYPSDGECLACHNRSAGLILGASTRQWNRRLARESDGGENQLLVASERGLFDRRLAAAAEKDWPRLAPAGDETASLATRARSYLDANCSQCHRAGNVVQVGFDARFSVPLEKQGLIRGLVRYPGLPQPDEYLIKPKDPDRSRLYSRVAALRMPPLGHLLRDDEGVALLRAWILALEGAPPLAPVQIAVSPGNKSRTFRVRLHHADPRANIHYATDGGAPSRQTPRYTKPMELKAPITLRAIAYREGFSPSRLVTRRFDSADR